MKRRVVSSKDNKRSFRWLQAAGQCKAPFTVIIDLSFARAVVREANLSPSLKQSAIVHFGGNATKLMNDKLETPCRVVVTAATMAAADKYRNEVRDAQQAKRENEQREQKEIQQQQKQQQQQNQDASKATKQQQQQHEKQKAAAVITMPKDTTTPTGSYVEEDFRIANDVRAFLKSCELWSPPPAVMESRGPGNEQKSVAEAVIFGRPSMELRADAARPPRHGVIVATHNPDTKIEIANALNKFSAHNEVAVCVLRCLSKPFALRLDPLNENMKNTTMGASRDVNVGGAAANPVNNMISSAKSPLQQQKQPPLSQRAAADLHFVKKLQEQNLISNKKANFVVKSIGGDSILSSKKLKLQQEQEEETKRRAMNLKQDEAVANADEENAVDGTTSNESKFQIEKKKVHAIHDKDRVKKAKKENHHRHDNTHNSSSSNPLATKKKLVRVPLKISKQ